MFRRRIALAALVCAFALACGERYGEPIVAVLAEPGDGAAPNGGSAGTRSGSAGSGDEPPSGGGGGGEPPAAGPLGLCAACIGSDSCGDANDACLRQGTELFCGRDCDEGSGCPDGYQCVQLENSRLWQCAPSDDCPESAATPPLPEVRAYLLERINTERAARDRPPLSSSSCLDDLAQASAVEYAGSERPFGKFNRECDPIWPNCACGWSAQAELAVAEWGLDWTLAIEQALGSDQLLDYVLDVNIQGIGLGFWISGDEAWIALSFR